MIKQDNRREFMELLDVKQASKFLNLSKVSIYRLTSKKKIPHYKIGSKILFDKEKLIDFIGNLEVVLV